jgi:hypothetical protein
MPWVNIPIGVKSYQPRSGTQSIERVINMYAQPSEANGKTGATLLGLPGLKAWSTVGDGPIRGLEVMGSDLYVVSGGELWVIDSGKASVLIGAIAGLGPVRMINDGVYVVICTNGPAYAANRAGILALPQGNLSGAAFQDGYGIYVQDATQNLWISGLDDLTTINALDFTTADAQPDNVVGCISKQRQVWVFKERTVEVFDNTGNASFPFERTGGGYMERGCAAPGSIAKILNFVCWLGDDLRVYRASGYVEEAISTPSIDRLIQDAYSPTTAEAFAYTQDGQSIYSITFADLTLQFNMSTGAWSERRSYGLPRWRAGPHEEFAGLHLVGDYEDGRVYELSLDTYDEDGEPLERIMVTPPLSADPEPLFIHELVLDMEAGVGLPIGQGSAPKVILAWSDDDGRTWSNDRERTPGALGEYRRRVNFTRLGRSQNRSFRFTVSDPVKVALLQARARVEKGVL